VSDTINITIQGKAYQVAPGQTLLELSKLAEGVYPFLLAKINNQLLELFHPIKEDCEIEYLDVRHPDGFKAYQRSCAFLMICSAKEILGKKARVIVEHSINKNLYCEIPDEEVTEELLESIEARMHEYSGQNIPIEKFILSLTEGTRIAREFGLEDKAAILKYRRSSSVNFYRLSWFYDYFYGAMVPSTGCISFFKLVKHAPGFILQTPMAENPEILNEIRPMTKITQVFRESASWLRILNVSTVGSLNDQVCNEGLGTIIRVSEALHEKRIAEIADTIYRQGKSIVLIAGPSSSGKTTFSGRLSVQLQVNGLKPKIISLDDYFLDRERTPLDEFGRLDFECLEALDVEQINKDLSELLAGKEVRLPRFNFITGKREYRRRLHKLESGGVLIIEGIHGLNEKLTEYIPAEDKFKIFISALTQLNLDDHNRIPTTDTRMIRRMVRDNRTRGFDALHTIDIWPSVMRGENKYIFPFQEEADAIFNSALVYELCVLKQYAEPLLLQIDPSMPQYTEARRLAKFLDSFLGLSSEEVPPNSILREFIGGSCFG